MGARERAGARERVEREGARKRSRKREKEKDKINFKKNFEVYVTYADREGCYCDH